MGCGNPVRGPFTILDPESFAQTCAQKLIPCVDKIRDIATKMGVRPYRVDLIHTGWSGGSRGVGIEEVRKIETIVPTPLVSSLDALEETLQAVGIDETGNVKVSEISGAYCEEFLRGFGERGEPIPEDENFYWEITFIGNNRAIKRRFLVRGTPSYDAENLQWIVTLIRASEDRLRDGTPEG